jgi:hypothetical protein
MVRVLQIFCVLICLSAGAVLALSVHDLGRVDPEVQRICEQPSVLQRYKELRSQRDTLTEKNAPLVVQASAFAVYLNGPVVQEKKEVVATERKNPRNIAKAPKVRVVPTAKFKLEGTSYYPNQPERSIALIAEPGSNEENPRWVKEGERLGRFFIQKIKRGVVVYRDENEQLHEMSIERKTATRSLVRDHISSLTTARAEFGKRLTPGGQPDSNSLAE